MVDGYIHRNDPFSFCADDQKKKIVWCGEQYRKANFKLLTEPPEMADFVFES